MYDYIIIGAGFAGCVMAERLASVGQKILIIDKRPHIGGNAYDYYDDAGVLVHKYGPHIFHTNSDEVFEYLSRFTEWRPYEHKVLSSVRLDKPPVPIPINRNTLNQLYPDLDLKTDADVEAYLFSVADKKIIPNKNSENAVVSKVGWELYELMFKGYTYKQWGVEGNELDASVSARIPVRFNEDDRYFTDKHQAMPKDGYSSMFLSMLLSEDIEIRLNTDYKSIVPLMLDTKVIYTGPIDEYFGFVLGHLPYRSLDFEFLTLEQEMFQPVGQINFPNDHNYTRITEFKHLTGQVHPQTTICMEFPKAEGDPYYPIPCEANGELYEQYKALAAGLNNTYFIGRLATYKYYNMDQVVAQALSLFNKLLNQKED